MSTSPSFHGSGRIESPVLHLRNRIRAGRITDDLHIHIFFNLSCKGRIFAAFGIHFIHTVQNIFILIIIGFDKYLRMFKTKIQTIVKIRHVTDLFIRNHTFFHVFKDSPACSGDFPHVVVRIIPWFMDFEPFRTFKEPFSKPFHRHIKIIAMKHPGFRFLPTFLHILVHKVILTFGRVENFYI